MEIKRDLHLKRLIARKANGMIKVIKGIRRCGNPYLLFHLFYNYLREQGLFISDSVYFIIFLITYRLLSISFISLIKDIDFS